VIRKRAPRRQQEAGPGKDGQTLHLWVPLGSASEALLTATQLFEPYQVFGDRGLIL
jgi:hypothetical protein